MTRGAGALALTGCALGLAGLYLLGAAACKRTVPAAASPGTEEYHADFDIAMTVRSAADAIQIGEDLDPADYDFEGVLTDGQGAPLYTDIQGSPGQWKVEVTSPRQIRIHNLYLGDLLPGNLEQYLTETLNLPENSHVATDEYDDDNDSDVAVYELPGGTMRIETRKAHAPNGIEGPLVSIVVSADDR